MRSRSTSIALFAVVFAPALGCATSQPSSMTYESCAAARFCTISGVVTARQADHAWMGQLGLPDGRCVSVSLPEAQLAELRQKGPKEMIVSGRVYDEPPPTIVDMRIQGRKIGFGLCDDFFVFVR